MYLMLQSSTDYLDGCLELNRSAYDFLSHPKKIAILGLVCAHCTLCWGSQDKEERNRSCTEKIEYPICETIYKQRSNYQNERHQCLFPNICSVYYNGILYRRPTIGSVDNLIHLYTL